MSKEWNQGLCGCMDDCGICLCGSFCEPCLVVQNANNLGDSGPLCCLLYLVVPCLPTFLLRQKAQDKYGINGDSTSYPCYPCAPFICNPCVNCQTAAEIKHHEDN